ncbi:XRE family transcriptional regulator [Metapseudomonas furukawaii]|uniref:XRE family transcriptional regulator n=1 Tax=Metapseudomonas furukawaii TaxID=1149133 RepID=UPI00404664EF
MLEGLTKRLRECAAIAGSGDELARTTGIPRRTLETYLAGKSEVKASRLLEIADAVGVSLDWLIAGRGSPQGAQSGTPSEDDGYAYIPLYDARCSAGHGAWNERTQVLTHLAFTHYSLRKKSLNSENLSAIRVAGDSNEPVLCDGDTLLIDHSQNTLQAEGVYVVLFDEHLYAKRLQRQFDGSVLIISENKAYPPMALPRDRLDSLQIIGRAVWVGGWLF